MLSYRWLITSGSITLLLVSCGQTKSLSSGEIYNQVKGSVALISYQYKGGHGTGFFVEGAKDVCTVVTARHVVEKSSKLQIQTLDRKLWKTSNIKRFPDYDLAVVTFKAGGENCPYPSLSLGNSQSVQVGDRVYVNGYPDREGQLVPQFVSGEVSAIANPALPDGYGISYPVTTARGMSGGPVVNADGQVIAVHGRADTEVATIVQLKGGELPRQQPQSITTSNSGEVAAQVGTYKWSVPINIYLANISNIANEVVPSPSALKTAKDWWNEGNDFLSSKRYEEAIDAFDEAITIKPDYDLAWHSRGWALHQLQQYEQAIAAYEKAIEIKPYNPDIWYNKAWSLEQLQRYSDALVSYDKALKLKPDYADVWNNRGTVLFYLKRYKEALTSFDKAIQFKPDYSGAWQGRGATLSELNQYENAITSFEKAIETNGEWGNKSPADAYDGKGYALSQLKLYKDAIVAYDKAVQIKPDLANAWYNRGVILSKLKQYEEAIASFEKAIQFKPDYAEAWHSRGVALSYLKRYEDAIASFEKAIQFQPKISLFWYNRGVILSKLKQYDEAIASFEKAIEANSEWVNNSAADAWAGRGIALENLRRYEEALKSYDKAIQMQPNYQIAIDNRKELLSQLGRSQ